MSRIDELITKFCPEGVPFKPLGELLDYEQPGKYLVESTKYDDSFSTPVLTAGQTFVLGYTDETSGIYPASDESPVIIFDDFTTAFKWVDFPFKAKSSAMKMLTPKRDVAIDFRFVYFAMQCIRFTPQDHARHWISKYSSFRIPVPPIDVQREIVNFLDQLTDLKVQLEGELEARQLQYSHYRETLLTFPEEDVRWDTLGGISVSVSSGGTPLSSRRDYYDGGEIPWLRTQEVRFVDICVTAMKITETALANSSAKWIPANCVIVAISGATAGRSAINKIPLTTNQHCCNFEIDPTQASYRYVFYWVRSQYEQIKSLGQGARSDLNASIIKNVKIPVPPLEEQERIVSILDKFDALVNDTSIGLPAELAARRKQYEHYRDRLLTFEELAV